MPTLGEVKEQIKRADGKDTFLTWREVQDLPNVLADGETIQRVAQAGYNGVTGMLLATDQRLIFIKTNLLNKAMVHSYPFSNIASLNSKPGLLFTTFNIGLSDGDSVIIQTIANVVAQRICDYVQPRIGVTSPPQTVQSSNMTSELERLANLRQQGLLDEQEFADAKQQIIAKQPRFPPADIRLPSLQTPHQPVSPQNHTTQPATPSPTPQRTLKKSTINNIFTALVLSPIFCFAAYVMISDMRGSSQTNMTMSRSSTTATTETPAPAPAEPVKPSKPDPKDSPAFKKKFAALLDNLRGISGVTDAKQFDWDHSMGTINVYVPVGTSKDQAREIASEAYREFVLVRTPFYGEDADNCQIGIRDTDERLILTRNNLW